MTWSGWSAAVARTATWPLRSSVTGLLSSSPPGQAAQGRLEERGVLGVEPQPGRRPPRPRGWPARPPGTGRPSGSPGRSSRGRRGGRRGCRSGRPRPAGRAAGPGRRRPASALTRRSPAQGKPKPDRTRSCRPSVATTWPRPPWSWMQSRAYRVESSARRRGRLGQGVEQPGRAGGPGRRQRRGTAPARSTGVTGCTRGSGGCRGPPSGRRSGPARRPPGRRACRRGPRSRPGRRAAARSARAGRWSPGSTYSTARSGYRCCARSWPPSARSTSGGTMPRWAMPRAERRKTARSRRAWLRVSVIMVRTPWWSGSGSVNDAGCGDGPIVPPVRRGCSGGERASRARSAAPGRWPGRRRGRRTAK